MNIYKNMTQLHVKQITENGALTVHTYDPKEGHFLHYNVGFIPNLGENLIQRQVDEFNGVLAQLDMVQKYRIVPDGLQVLDNDGKIIVDSLVFNPSVGVFGLVLYFVSPLGKAAFGQMSNAELRLTSLEHPLVNLIAIILITVGWSTHKKAADSNTKFKKITVFYAIGLLLILSRIPWNNWI